MTIKHILTGHIVMVQCLLCESAAILLAKLQNLSNLSLQSLIMYIIVNLHLISETLLNYLVSCVRIIEILTVKKFHEL